jgi:hypothetical protein
MPARAGTAVAGEALRRRHDALVAELRGIDHWRRLVAARLDLAVAAVTATDELPVRALQEASMLPFGLRDLVGLPTSDDALPEAGALIRLRAVLRDLDAYAVDVRAALRTTAAGLGQAEPDLDGETHTASVIPFPRRPRQPASPAQG